MSEFLKLLEILLHLEDHGFRLLLVLLVLRFIIFFTFSDAICSPPRIRTASNIWKGSGYVQPGTDEKIVLPGGTGNNALFWPFFGAKSGRHRQRSSHRHLRTRWLKNVTSMSDLSAIPMTIHSGKV